MFVYYFLTFYVPNDKSKNERILKIIIHDPKCVHDYTVTTVMSSTHLNAATVMDKW